MTSPPLPPPASRKDNPATSRDAARAARHRMASQNRAILELLEAAGTTGRTCREIDQHYGWEAATAGRRMATLRRAGLVIETTRERAAERGRPGMVYEISEGGREVLHAEVSRVA